MTQKTDFTFFHPLRVRWSECDAQGIVFNVNYFLYFDIGIWEYTRKLGYSKADAPEFVTARAECDFRGSAQFDDEIMVGVRTARLGTKSTAVAFGVFRGDTLLAEGMNTYVAVKRGTTETAPLDPDYIERILGFEKTPPTKGAAQ